MVEKKEKMVAVVLAFLLGGIGAHKFYLRQVGLGIVYLLFCLTYIPSIIAFIEGIILLTMSKEEFDHKYNQY
jgi:TM2 domain-containing membrane protein YozV